MVVQSLRLLRRLFLHFFRIMESLDWKCSGVDSYYVYVKSTSLSGDLLENLYRKGKESPTGRARLCMHDNPADGLNFMVIYHDERTIVPIHRHSPHGEHIVLKEGELELILFDSELSVSSSCKMSQKHGGDFGCFTPPNVWHTLKFSKPTIFFEISKGPFDGKITQFATFP